MQCAAEEAINVEIRIDIVYYSGTGGTKQVAECLADTCRRQDYDVVTSRLFQGKEVRLREDSILLVLYAVHACNAPEPVYHFIDSLPIAQNNPAAVISVSGGGEVIPNTACRLNCIKRLEKKGYPVFYEKMLVMPPNAFVGVEKPLAQHILYVLPKQVESVVRDISNRRTLRTRPFWTDRVLSRICEIEKVGAHLFGKRIRVTGDCTGCGLCARECPAGNITMCEKKPEFGDTCQLCLNCIYACPRKALKPGMMKFIVITKGYPLREYRAMRSFTNPNEIKQATKGVLWIGVRKYLLEAYKQETEESRQLS